MATEAEIIPESLSLMKAEEAMESKSLTLELCDRAVELLPGDLKKLQGEIIQKIETVECLDKAESKEVASNNGVETMNTVSEDNPEISKGESFIVPPEVSEVAKETPLKAEKILEDEEKKAVNNKFQLKEEAGTGEIQGAKADEAADTESNKLEDSLELKEQALTDTPEPTSNSLEKANETVTEASNSELVQSGQEEKSFKEVEDADTEPEKLPAIPVKEEGIEAVEASGTEKDQMLSDGNEETLTSTLAEGSEKKDHQTTSEISEVDEKELRNPNEEVASVPEAAPEVDEKLQEVSSVVGEDKSQDTIESSEEIRIFEKIAEKIQEAEKKHESPEDNSNKKTMEEKAKEMGILEDEKPQEPDAVVDQAVTISQASITEESMEAETISSVEKLHEGKVKEAENLGNEKGEDSSTKKTEEPNEVDKTEEEIQNEDSDAPQAALEGESIGGQVMAEESQEHGTLTGDNKTKEAETVEDEITPESECPVELQGAIEDGATATQTLSEEQPEDHITASVLPSEVQEDTATQTLSEDGATATQTLPEEKPEDHITTSVLPSEVQEDTATQTLSEEKPADHITTSILPSEVQEDETKETELPEEVSNSSTKETESNEVPKENLLTEDKEVTEASYSTPQSEELAKGGSGEDELKDKLIEDKTNEAVETTCQTEELVAEAQKASEDEITEKQVIFEDKTVEDPGHASVAMIETGTVKEEESSTELSQAEGAKDLADGKEIIDDIQQPEETTDIASDKQISREFDPIENTAISSPIELQDKVGESSQKDEVGDVKEIYPEVVEHTGEKATDNSGEEITKESTSVEDSTKESSSDCVEISTNETLQVTQDMIVETEAKDETGTEEKLEEQPLAPSSELPTEEEEHGVATKVDAVEEKEPKEVETLDKDSSDSKTGEQICLEKEENEELKAVVEQETIALQTPATDHSGEEINKESTSVEDSTKESSSSDHVEISTKEALQVTQDRIEESEAKDETGAAQTLPEEQSVAPPSSELPTEEEEHGVTAKVHAVEEKELKEVGTLDKDSSDTKTGEEICLEKDENKELKAVVEQEAIAVQAPPIEVKEDSVSHLEDGRKEDELKDEHAGEKTTEVLSVETVKDSANKGVEKETVAEDKTVQDLEAASVDVKEATTVREEIAGEADSNGNRTRSSFGKEHVPTEQQDRALEASEKPEVKDLEPGKAQEICPEAGVEQGEEERKTENTGMEITQEPASADSGKFSLSDLLQRSTDEKMQVAERVIDLTVNKEEAETIETKEAKPDEEKNGEEGVEHNKTDTGSESAVMVEAPRDTDTKSHKKSHNILSGVGSKVKHSISKVKKAITGKSSQPKESKPISPKESEK
ncbi:hypothetical protein PTKIN_Ptkin08bG0028500 [Pterospermum kingtungense]